MALEPYSLMGGGTLEFEWAPHRDEPFRVAAAFDQAAVSLEHMRGMLSAASQIVRADVRSHFDAEEGPDGPWPTRAGSTESVQFAFVPGQGHVEVGRTVTGAGDWPLLNKTGAGIAGATANSAYHIETDPEGGTITFDAMPPDFMMAHNVGLPERERPLPQREWLYLSEAAGEGIFQLFEDFVGDATALVTNPMTGITSIRSSLGTFTGPAQFYL